MFGELLPAVAQLALRAPLLLTQVQDLSETCSIHLIHLLYSFSISLLQMLFNLYIYLNLSFFAQSLLLGCFGSRILDYALVL